MKLSVGMIALNEEQFIESSLKCIYSHVDEIVIVEGCVKEYSNPIHSIDKTVEIVKDFPDPNKKIKFIQIDRYWKTKEEMRNAYLEEMKGIPGDYLLVVDADECYKKDELIRLKELTRTGDWICIMYPHIHFWHSFDYYVYSNAWQGTQLRFSQFEKGFKYKVHYTLGDKRKKYIQWDKFYNRHRLFTRNHICERYPKKALQKKGIIVPDVISIYHYAHLKSEENMRAKVDYYTRRRGQKTNPKKASGWFDSRWKDKKTFENNPEVIKFSGEHPQAIKEKFKL